MRETILSERKKKILQVVIHHHIKTTKPVSSEVIVNEYGFELSPATVRNVLTELESDGYLTHPFTSAGRVPTDRGYRFYVDTLEDVQRLTIEEMDRIRKEYIRKRVEQEEIMKRTTHMLCTLSSYAGFVMVPKLDKSKLKQLEILSLENNRILIVLVTETGLVRHKIVQLKNALPDVYLSKLSDVLNRRLRGLSLNHIKTNIIPIIEEEFNKHVKDTQLIKFIFQQVLNFSEREMYLENTANLMREKSQDDYMKMKLIYDAVEEKKRLVKILQSIIREEGIKVLIGEEFPEPKMKNCSIVTSTYKTDENMVGALGIIGPKNMEYSKIISIVDFVARLMNKLLDRK